MGSVRYRGVATLVLMFGLVLGACGGAASGPANDPQGTVSAALAAAQSGGLSKLTDFACAAHKSDIAGALGGTDMGALTAAGVKPEDVLGAMTMAFSNIATKEISRTDTTATVHVTGTSTITIDKEKFKSIAKTMFTAQGLPADDATLDAMIGPMTAQLAAPQPLDEDIKLVNEGGKWLLCQ